MFERRSIGIEEKLNDYSNTADISLKQDQATQSSNQFVVVNAAKKTKHGNAAIEQIHLNQLRLGRLEDQVDRRSMSSIVGSPTRKISTKMRNGEFHFGKKTKLARNGDGSLAGSVTGLGRRPSRTNSKKDMHINNRKRSPTGAQIRQPTFKMTPGKAWLNR